MASGARFSRLFDQWDEDTDISMIDIRFVIKFYAS
jgi:hypothetical protein